MCACAIFSAPLSAGMATKSTSRDHLSPARFVVPPLRDTPKTDADGWFAADRCTISKLDSEKHNVSHSKLSVKLRETLFRNSEVDFGGQKH